MNKNLLEYQGRLSSEVRIQLLDLIQCIALCNLGPRGDLKKLIGVALELLDNAQRYNAGNDVDFTWHISGDQLVVCVTNKATGKNADRLMNTVQEIARMSPKDISTAFKNQLLNDGFGEQGGAGLGMLQIARKVGNSISAEVEPLEDGQFICRSEVTTPLLQ